MFQLEQRDPHGRYRMPADPIANEEAVMSSLTRISLPSPAGSYVGIGTPARTLQAWSEEYRRATVAAAAAERFRRDIHRLEDLKRRYV